MKAITRLLPATLIVACLTSPAAFAASFDCSKARTLVETAICTTPSLSAKDDLLNEHYRPLQHLKIIRELERQWLREVRNRCAAVSCIEEAYDQQNSRLTPVPANPQAETPALKPSQDQQPYLQIEDAVWQRFALATFPQASDLWTARWWW